MSGFQKAPVLAFLFSTALLLFDYPVFSAGVVGMASQASLMTAMSGGGTVSFGFNGTIYLTNTITVSNNTILDATGQNVTISGSNAVQIFIVNSGVTFALSNLTLADGLAVGVSNSPDSAAPGCGGAISNSGTLQAVNCVFTNNGACGYYNANNGGPSGAFGGAVYNAGSASFSQCLFITNWALGVVGEIWVNLVGSSANGGALYNAGSVTLDDCLFSNNFCMGGAGPTPPPVGSPFAFQGGTGGEGCGGAICTSSSLQISNSTLAVNFAVGGMGGTGSAGQSDSGNVNNEPGLKGGNGGQAGGGGFCIQAGTASIINSTFWSNTSAGGAGGSGGAGGVSGAHLVPSGAGGNGGTGGNGLGGAICNLGGSLSLTNITVASNVPAGGVAGRGGAGGAGFFGPGGPMGASGAPGVPQGDSLAIPSGALILKNSILAANSASDTNIFGAITDAGNNISYDDQSSLTNSTSQNSVNPLLAPLGNYGGPTATMALLAGSPAIDAADASSFPATDQRGYPRPFGPAPDIGAFEYSPGFISGNVLGLLPPDEVTVNVGTFQTLTTNGGFFALALPGGVYTVTPGDANYVFSPASPSVNVGANGANVIFQAYRINTISLGRPTNGMLQAVYSGTNGQSFRIFASSNLSQWVPISTNVLGAAGFVGLGLPATNSPRQFYRVVSP